MRLATITALYCFALEANLWAQSSIGKIVDSYLQGTTTHMMIESNRMLNTSQPVYLHGGIPIAVREVMSIRETEGVYYYRAYTPEKVRILPGESIFLEPLKKDSRLPEFERKAIFLKKKYATVTLVEEDKVLVNRGSLHNVDKRDVYRVFDQNGKIKGEIELYGIGDFLSAGSYRYPVEFGGKGESFHEGDSAVFVGNRKVIGLTPFHFVLYQQAGKGLRLGADAAIYQGLGITTWSFILRKGNIFEWMIGAVAAEKTYSNLGTLTSEHRFPFWFRKTFFYPSFISPSLSFGFSFYRNELIEKKDKTNTALGPINSLGPLLGAGVEFFTSSAIHLRLDGHYYPTPSRTFNDKKYRTDALFLLGGISINW